MKPVKAKHERTRSTKRHGIKFTMPSKTKQSEAKATDINTIVGQFQRGDYSALPDSPGYDEDGVVITPSMDYHEAMNVIVNAEQHFQQLPSKVRKEFDNNPQKYLEYCENDNNIPAMIERGWMEPVKISSSNADSEAGAEAGPGKGRKTSAPQESKGAVEDVDKTPPAGGKT
mgnify:CR=1 FL=1